VTTVTTTTSKCLIHQDYIDAVQSFLTVNVYSDDCRNDCTSALCGDGVVQVGEECDDGNSFNNDSCTNDCKNAKVRYEGG
jgi:cysteine-rich repeat protein